MAIEFAHLRERAINGGWINFAVFNADSVSNMNQDRAKLLSQLTMRARANGLKVDQSALVFSEHGQTNFFGDRNLVAYLSKNWRPYWTHTLDV